MSTKKALRKALVAATAAGALVILGGCAEGTHPGAAAVVGDRQISDSELHDITVAANKGVQEARVKLKIEQVVPELSPGDILSALVESARVSEVLERKSVVTSPAELAAARKEFGIHQVYIDGFQLGGPLSQRLYEHLVSAALGQAKLAGTTSIDPKSEEAAKAQMAGRQIVLEESRNFDITVSPRYGTFDPAKGLVPASGSLSDLSPQTKAIKDAEEAKRRAEQQQPQG